MICFFLWSFLITCTGRLVQSSCPIELNPSRVVVRFGDSLKANCSSTREVEGIGWESTHGGIGLTTGVSYLPFHIPVVKDWNIQSMCYVNILEDGSQCLEALPITVYKTPDRVSLSGLPNMIEGRRYSMQCAIVGVAPAKNLSVWWHKGNQIVYTETFSDSTPYPVNKSSVFNLTAVRDDNGASYWCEAKLNFGSPDDDPPAMQSKPQRVTVYYPPTFMTPENETVEVEAGKALSLDCSATGSPLPTYIWSFPDSEKKVNKNLDLTASTLNLQSPPEGIYTCTASNALGNTNKYYSVIEATGDRTTFAALLGVFTVLGVLLIVAGLIFMNQNGMFVFNK